MSYSASLFNKELYKLEFSDIVNFFIINREETLFLEFKSYVEHGEFSKKIEAIKKAVCGLLNSEGGIIIWGAPLEVKDPQGNTSAVGNLTPFTSTLDKDRLINILTSSIIPFPVGIKVQVLKNQQGDSIFIIEVEKSIEKPHQFDNKYFIRLDGQTRIAPHYLISAMMKSVNFPVIKGHLRLKEIRRDGNYFDFHFRKLLFNTSIFNNDINIYMRIITSPGHIYFDNKLYGSIYNQEYPIISNGAPLMSNFILKISNEKLDQDINIIFQFGGEKSPSKISTYRYRFNQFNVGNIVDETPYLIEKSENKLPSDFSNNTVDQNIEILLNQ